MELKDGWLLGVRHVPSPHFNIRPQEEAPGGLVVHNCGLPPG